MLTGCESLWLRMLWAYTIPPTARIATAAIAIQIRFRIKHLRKGINKSQNGPSTALARAAWTLSLCTMVTSSRASRILAIAGESPGRRDDQALSFVISQGLNVHICQARHFADADERHDRFTLQILLNVISWYRVQAE